MIPRRKARSRSGFALVMVISIMAFLLLLLVGLGLVLRLETGAASAQQKMAEARQNAILGLYTAIGQLQELAGPDQRVTANAGISTNPVAANPHWTGVWQRKTNAPLLPGGTGTYEPHPSQFMGWLVSGKDSRATNNAAAAIKEGSSVKLLTDVANAADHVAVATESVLNGTKTNGHFAYWVSDESLKAKINLEDDRKAIAGSNPTSNNLVTALNLASARPPELSILNTGFSDWTSDAATNRKRILVEFLQDATLVEDGTGNDALRTYFHDLTTHSKGVLSDTLNGGLKKDLSLAFNMGDADFGADTFFSDTSGDFTNTITGWTPPDSLPQPDPKTEKYEHNFVYRVAGASVGSRDVVGPTWSRMRSFFRLPDNVQGTAAAPYLDFSGKAVSTVWNVTGTGDGLGSSRATVNNALVDKGGFPFGTDARLQGALAVNGPIPRPTSAFMTPVLAQVGYVISLTQRDSATAGKKDLGLVLDAFISVWNPYNIPVRVDAMRVDCWVPNLKFQIHKSDGTTSAPLFVTPAKLQTKSTGVACIIGKAAGDAINDANAFFFLFNSNTTLNSKIELQPGEVRIFYGQTPSGMSKQWLPMYSTVPDTTASGMKYWDWPTGVGAAATAASFAPADELTVEITADDAERMLCKSYVGVFRQNVGNLRAAFFWQPVSNSSENGFALRTTENAVRTGSPSSVLVTSSGIASSGGKLPVAVVRSYLRDLSDSGSFPSRFMLEVNPRGGLQRHYGGPYGSPEKFMPNYELRAADMTVGPGQIPGEIGAVLSGGFARGYWGNGHNASQNGVNFASLFSLPMRPPLSLGEFQHYPADDWHHTPAYAIGNSFATPFVDATKVVDGYNGYSSEGGFQTQVDHSYLLNHYLFDSFYFSSIGPRPDRALTQAKVVEALADPYSDERKAAGKLSDGPLPNPRIVVRPGKNKTDVMAALNPPSIPSDPKDRPYSKAAEMLMVDGPFNVNSTSVNAWKTVLASAGNMNVPVLEPDSGGIQIRADSGIAFPRCLPANGGTSTSKDDRWRGYRSLTTTQIGALAEKIVDEVKKRGPFLSLSDFVNRRLEVASEPTSQRGAIQAAIDAAGINTGFTLVSPTDFKYPANAVGHAEAGSPGYLLQGDILQALAPVLTARGDTFLVRAYGDAVSPSKPNDPEARAYCEAIVQRLPEKVDSSEAVAAPDSAGGVGRRFRIVAFRWIHEEEI